MTSRVIFYIVIPLVSSTNQIYHLAASRLGDKFDGRWYSVNNYK